MKVYEMKTSYGSVQARRAGAIVLNFPDDSSVAVLTEGETFLNLMVNRKPGSLATKLEERYASACKKTQAGKEWDAEEKDAMLVYRGIATELFGDKEDTLDEVSEILDRLSNECSAGFNELTEEEMNDLS